MNGKVICNSLGKNSRQVVVSPEGIVRDIIKVERHRQSWQLGFPGDFVFQQSWNNEKVLVIEEDNMVDSLSLADAGLAWSMCPDGLKIWLEENIGASEHILPAGFGWDGQHTVAEQKKVGSVTNFFKELPQEELEKIIDLAKFSPKSGLEMNWKEVPKNSLPKKLEAEAGKAWVIWNFNGTVQLLDKLATTKDVRGAAQLTFGAYNNAKGKYGITWKLFR